jgi:hypothetical protein
MAEIRLFLDEDVWVGLAAALRSAGIDAVSAGELNRKGYSDESQLQFAIEAQRTILTHNVQDFAPLARECAANSIEHHGIIVAPQLEKGKLLQRTLVLLNSLTAAQLANTLRFI